MCDFIDQRYSTVSDEKQIEEMKVTVRTLDSKSHTFEVDEEV